MNQTVSGMFIHLNLILAGTPLSSMEHFAVAGVDHAGSGHWRPVLQWVVLPLQCYFGAAATAGLRWLLRVMSMGHGDWSRLAVVSLVWTRWLLLLVGISSYDGGDCTTTTNLGVWQMVTMSVASGQWL